jgi:CRISPR/Cas system-associated exonuclease Cas4 (RecB family)
LVLGSLAQLEDALATDISRAKAAGPLAPATVLVDNSLLKQQLPRAMALRGAAHLNVRYVRPDELAQHLAAQAEGASPLPRLTRDAEQFLLRDVAATADGYFRTVAGRDGFTEALTRLFRELEMGGFGGESLRRALGAEANDASSKAGQLARLFDEYARRRSGFASRADAYAAARGTRLDGPLFVYGVWSPSKLQADLIEYVASLGEVTVYLPASQSAADDAHRAFRDRLSAIGATVDRLVSGAEHTQSQPAAEKPQPRPPAGSPQLSIFGSDGAPPSNNDHQPSSSRTSSATLPSLTPPVPTRLYSAPDTVREVWEAARWCLDRAREGVRFHEMAIVYRNRDPYRALVDEIFSEANITTYLHDGRLLSSHPWGRRLLMLLDLASEPDKFERAEVMEFLTETRLPRATRQRYEDVERGIFVRPSEWETYSREAGVVEGAEQWHERLQRLAGEKRETARDERFDFLAGVADRIEVFARFAADFHAALAARPAEATWDEHLRFMRGLAGAYAEDTGEILDALDDLKLVAAVRPRVTFAEFCRAVRDDLDWRDTTNVLHEPVREFGRRGVAVLDASSLRHLRFRAVWLLGVAERAWPPPARPDPLLLEHERRAINESGAGTLPLRTEPDTEALQFWLALQSASEHVALSYARADAGRSGKHLPSYFFRAVAESLAGVPLSLEQLEGSAHVTRIEAGRLAHDDVAASLSRAEYDRGLIRGAITHGDPASVAALGAESPSFAAAVAGRRARWSRSLTPQDGVAASGEAIAAARARSPFARGEPVSASRLEMYATCPYRYFLRYGLGIEPIEEPETVERMDHLQRGVLIHEILQRFLTRIGRDDPPREERRAEHLRILIEIARECGEERVRRGVTGRPLIWQRDRMEMEEDLDRWYGYEVREIGRSGLLPGAFEARFGRLPYGNEHEDPLSTDEPLALNIGGGTVLVHGRVDRIDWDGRKTQFRVIDYKTGKFYKGGLLDRGESLQLPLYLHAAARALGLTASAGEAQYFHATSRGDFKRRVVGGDEIESRRADLDQVLSTIERGVDEGFFAPNPLNNHCQWCDYKQVCPGNIEKIMERKAGDPRGDEYRALEEIL